MATMDKQLVLTLEAGESQLSTMRFVPGRPLAPLTIGREAMWRVDGGGVRPVHVSVTFDGEQLYVSAASTDVPVYINGAPIDERWWPMQPPSELRFGAVRLRLGLIDAVSTEPAPAALGATTFLQEPSEPAAPIGARTSLDAAGHWAERNRNEGRGGYSMQQTIIGPPSRDPGQLDRQERRPATPQPREYEARAPMPAHAPAPAPDALRPGAPTQAVVAMPASPFGASGPAHAAHQGQPSAPPPVTTKSAPAVGPGVSRLPSLLATPDVANAPQPTRAPAASSNPPPMAATIVRPFGTEGSSAPTVPPQEAMASTLPRPYKYDAQGPPQGSPVMAPAAGPSQPPHASPDAWQAPPGWTPPAGGSHPPRPSESGGEPKAPSKLLEGWRGLSVPKKISAALVPAVFLLLLVPQPEESSPAPMATAETTSTAVAPAAAAATAAATGAGAPTANATANATAIAPRGTAVTPEANVVAPRTVPVAPKPEPTPAVVPPSPGTPAAPAPAAADGLERTALNAAFEGRWDDALSAYERLATAHPEQPAYAEAARIVRDKQRQR